MTAKYTDKSEVPYISNDIIGHGAVGVVDEVRSTAVGLQGQVFARKQILLDRDLDIRQQQLQEIENEVTALKRAEHEHAVQLVATYILEESERRAKYAIIMRPRADQNLDEYLANSRNQGEPGRGQLSGWIGCLVSAVAHLHDKHICHRDIKPSNILIHGRKILITDFGISMMGLGRTVPSTMVGRPRARTAEYCAPEVDRGHTRGRAADVFSLGAVFLEMVAAQVGPGELGRLRGELIVDSRRSYAQGIDRVSRFMDSLVDSVSGDAWLSEIVVLCRKMLQTERDRRPKAADIHLWLAHRFSPLPAPPADCRCGSALDALQSQSSRGGINEALAQAYRNGHGLVVDLLIQRGASMRSDEALVAACEGGMLDKAEALVRDGANPQCADAMRAACAGGRADVAQWLLSSGADASCPGALPACCAGGHQRVAQLLLTEGADPDGTDNEGRTGLHCAAAQGHHGIVRLLVERGADVDAKDGSGMTALQHAVRNYDREMVSLLMAAPERKPGV